MEFSWSEAEEQLYDSALAFARARLGISTNGEFSRDRWNSCAEFGFAGLCAPTAHEGMGLGALATARLIEALGRGCRDGGLVFSLCAHLFAAVMPIVEHGSTG